MLYRQQFCDPFNIFSDAPARNKLFLQMLRHQAIFTHFVASAMLSIKHPICHFWTGIFTDVTE